MVWYRAFKHVFGGKRGKLPRYRNPIQYFIADSAKPKKKVYKKANVSHGVAHDTSHWLKYNKLKLSAAGGVPANWFSSASGLFDPATSAGNNAWYRCCLVAQSNTPQIDYRDGLKINMKSLYLHLGVVRASSEATVAGSTEFRVCCVYFDVARTPPDINYTERITGRTNRLNGIWHVFYDRVHRFEPTIGYLDSVGPSTGRNDQYRCYDIRVNLKGYRQEYTSTGVDNVTGGHVYIFLIAPNTNPSDSFYLDTLTTRIEYKWYG